MSEVFPLVCAQCVAMRLDPDYVGYGAVVQRCAVVKRLVLSNLGDLGAKSVPCTMDTAVEWTALAAYPPGLFQSQAFFPRPTH